MAIGMAVALPRAPLLHQRHSSRPLFATAGTSHSSFRVPSSCPLRCAQRRPLLLLKAATSSGSRKTESDGGIAERDGAEQHSSNSERKRLRLLFTPLAFRPVNQMKLLPWAAGLICAVLMRNVIIQELRRWPNFFMQFVGALVALGFYISELLMKHAREPTMFLVKALGFTWLFLIDLYHCIVEITPVRALVQTMSFSTAVISLAESVRTNAASNQPWILGVASFMGLGMFMGFWDFFIMSVALGLLAIISYIRNRDLVIALLPAAATLVAVGKPLVQAGTFLFFTLLAIYRNWVAPETATEKTQGAKRWTSLLVFVLFTMAIGINVGVRWLQHHHLVWTAAA